MLAPGGLYQGTMLSTRHIEFGLGTEVRRRTSVREDADDDKPHPQLYCDRGDLDDLHSAFDWVEVREREQRGPGT